MSASFLDDAVLLTLAYSDIFATPLTAIDIHRRLIGFKSSLTQVKKSLHHLLLNNRLSFQNNYYFFPDRQTILKLSRQRQLVSKLKLKKAKIWAARLASLPSILAIYLTGSVAVANASPEADLDFLIITRVNQLWTTRFFLNLLLDILNLRRRPGNQFSRDKLCLNLFLTPNSLTLPPSKQNLHSAYELIQFKSLFERQPLQTQFYQANSWFQTYLPNFTFPSSPTFSQSLSSFSFNPLERPLFAMQRYYMRSKITHELINLHFAFFHPRPLYPSILSKLKSRLVRYNIKIWPQLQPFLT